MMALKQPKVVLEIALEGGTHVVAPRDVQRHPYKPIIEHVDLVILSRREVRERLVLGQALAKAEAVAVDQLPGFDAGLVSVQDEAAQLAAILLDLAPGQRPGTGLVAPFQAAAQAAQIEFRQLLPEPDANLAGRDRHRDALAVIVTDGLDAAMNRFNRLPEESSPAN